MDPDNQKSKLSYTKCSFSQWNHHVINGTCNGLIKFCFPIYFLNFKISNFLADIESVVCTICAYI